MGNNYMKPLGSFENQTKETNSNPLQQSDVTAAGRVYMKPIGTETSLQGSSDENQMQPSANNGSDGKRYSF